MTAPSSFALLADIVADLGRTLPQQERFQRLVHALHKGFPCDAIALLQLQGSSLVPRASVGLTADTAGRRFELSDHPRLSQIINNREPTRFPSDSDLPDPYDGLVENLHSKLYIHDCLGASLYIEDSPWGIITFDALTPNQFDSIDLEELQTFLSVAAATVRAADWIHQLEARIERHQRIEMTQNNFGPGGEIIGESDGIKQVMQEAKVVAASELTVLIMGETGVGKDLIARLVHHHSSRAAEPMIHINCAALPENLAESELFGHVRGAFSGATENRAGKFELAHESTLFLDEVGELPMSVQAKLLRTLQDGDIQRVGSDNHHKVDVRLIAATNRDLKQEVASGRFRSDLYHRLSVYPLVVPPLRERSTDILLLAGYFLGRDQKRLGLRNVRLSRRAQQWITRSNWPGNIRELEHTLSRGIIRALSEGQSKTSVIEVDIHHMDSTAVPHIQKAQEQATRPGVADDTPMKTALDDFKRSLIQARLIDHHGNGAAAAKSLGMERGNFYRLLRRLKLSA